MEERQLDFSLPLLSVRHNRQQSLPLNESINEHEEVKNSATVPFHWEQSPGKPKQEVEIPVQTPEQPSNILTETLKVPPGRESGPFNVQNILHLSCEDESDTQSEDDCYSVDEQTVMNRFVSAAKDVILETMKYVVKKPRVVVNEHRDNVGSEEQKKGLVHVKKSGKSWGIIAPFCANKLLGMKWKFHSSTRYPSGEPLYKDLPQIGHKLTLDEHPSKSPILDELCKKCQNHNSNNIASSHKLFKFLPDLPRNQVHVQRFGPMNDAVQKTLHVDFQSTSDYERRFDPSSLTPPLPKSPSESWLWRTIVKTSNLHEDKPWKRRSPQRVFGNMTDLWFDSQII